MGIVKKIVEKNSVLKRMAIKRFNTFDITNGDIFLTNVHSKDNKIYVRGSNNTFQNEESTTIRHSSIYVNGSDNIVKIASLTNIEGNGTQVIHIAGTGNEIVIGSGCRITNTSFFINGNNNRIIIGNNNSFIHTYIHIEGHGNTVRIGNECSFHGRTTYPNTLFSDEGKSIIIEDDAMLAHGIRVRNTDSHCIYNEKGERMNEPKDVYIGKHCWIGLDAILLKGAYIPENCVVAARSLCTRRFEEECCLIAGSPATVIKKGIHWERTLPREMEKEINETVI